MFDASRSHQREALATELISRFETLKDDYARLDADADQRIIYWRYAERTVFELRADYFRRFNEKPGKLLDVEPIEAFAYYAYGYDTEDRVIYNAFFQTEELPRSCAFYQYGEDYIEAAEYEVELYTTHYYLVRVSRVVQPNGKSPTVYGEYGVAEGISRYFYEEYHYDLSGRLTYILSHSESVPRPLSPVAQERVKRAIEEQRTIARLLGAEDTLDSTLPHLEKLLQGDPERIPSFSTEELYKYDGNQLQQIVSRSHRILTDGSSSYYEYIVYEAPRKGETKKMLFEAARVSVCEAIVEYIRRLDPAIRQEQVYNLVISYDAVADEGILLTLAPVSQREAWEQESSERSYSSLFEHQIFYWESDHASVWELPEDYARFLLHFRREERWEDIRKLMVRAAKDLNERDWSDVLNVTDDFIVVAYDHEALEDIEDNIRACVPKEKLKILKAKGLLD